MSEFRTSVGTSDADSITVMGRDVARELMGNVTLTELAFLLVQRRMPSSAETRLLDAVLISLADHGLTPIALAARLTHTGAPESLQGAVAAGLLGAGSVFLGVVEDSVRFIDEAGEDVNGAVAREIEAGRRIPGLGHPVHKVQDPRTPRIYEIACEQLGVEAEDCLFVGDGANDAVPGAQRVGMTALQLRAPGEPLTEDGERWTGRYVETLSDVLDEA